MDSGIGQFIPLILIIIIVVVVIKLRNKGRKTRIEEFNKKHGTKFKNELELNYYIATKLKKIDKVIGLNTINAVRSGFFWGYRGLIDNIVNLIKKETRTS